MKKGFIVIVLISAMFLPGSCMTASITWTPIGEATATVSLSSAKGAEFLAIRGINGQRQANPWTFYVPSKTQESRPRIRGEGKNANVVLMDASVDYELELGLYQSRGLLQQDLPEWHESKPVITLKALDPQGKYVMTFHGPAFSFDSGKKTSGILRLRKGLTPIQQWELYATVVPDTREAYKRKTFYEFKEVIPVF